MLAKPWLRAGIPALALAALLAGQNPPVMVQPAPKPLEPYFQRSSSAAITSCARRSISSQPTEISRQTGMSSSLVGVNIHRARKQLGELLGEDAERAPIGGVS